MANIPKQPTQYELDWVKANWIVKPEDGIIISIKTGKQMGALHGDQHLVVTMCGRQVYISHVIWWAHYGTWPKQSVDHDDRDKANNKIGNLVESSHSRQMLNRELPPAKYGRGVNPTRDSSIMRFEARIRLNGKPGIIASVYDPDEAAAIYAEAKKLLLSGRTFANHKELYQTIKQGI